jgi:hypothetical protein
MQPWLWASRVCTHSWRAAGPTAGCSSTRPTSDRRLPACLPEEAAVHLAALLLLLPHTGCVLTVASSEKHEWVAV